jgi:hypothetical protein
MSAPALHDSGGKSALELAADRNILASILLQASSSLLHHQ